MCVRELVQMSTLSITVRTPLARLLSALRLLLKGISTRECSGVGLVPLERARLESVEFEIPSQPEMIHEVRSRAADFARRMPFTSEQIDDIKLAVSEAATNALRHGATPDGCRIAVRLERRPDALAITVRDKGCGFDPDAVCLPGPEWLGENGRGIWFMRAVMDEVTFRSNYPGTVVELVKRFNQG